MNEALSAPDHYGDTVKKNLKARIDGITQLRK